MHLFAKKKIETVADAGNDLNRTLGAPALVALGIGAIIGTGIFVLTGTAAANHAGPALALSFILAGIACGFAGLCYAEFAAMMPVAGSAYSYSYATLAPWAEEGQRLLGPVFEHSYRVSGVKQR